MNKLSTVLAPTPTETKTAPSIKGCGNFIQSRRATHIWIHVYDAAVAALGENYAEF